MAQYSVDISGPAENDLLDIVRYIASQLSAPISAFAMLEDLEAAMSSLADMPQCFALVADKCLAQMGYRKLSVKNYIAFFSIDEINKAVNIERILYKRRDWFRLL